VQTLDVCGVVVTGDAIQAQRKRSRQIVNAHGDYLWTAKDNQPELREEIALLFTPHNIVAGLVARQGRTNLAEARLAFA